jgi:hypothetical protein
VTISADELEAENLFLRKSKSSTRLKIPPQPRSRSLPSAQPGNSHAQSRAGLWSIKKRREIFEPPRRACSLFHIEQARAFKRDLAEQRGGRSGEPLSKASLYATLTALKRFFVWLAGVPGYKSRITYADAEYFNLSAKDTRIAKATRPPLLAKAQMSPCLSKPTGMRSVRRLQDLALRPCFSRHFGPGPRM